MRVRRVRVSAVSECSRSPFRNDSYNREYKVDLYFFFSAGSNVSAAAALVKKLSRGFRFQVSVAWVKTAPRCVSGEGRLSRNLCVH